MKPLTAALAGVLAFLVGVPLMVIVMGAAVVTPAVAEQIRIDPCSAFDDQTNATAAGAEEGGLGFELPKWGSPRHQSLRSPAQTIPARIKKLYVQAATKYRIPWELLAGIGMAETRHGRNNTTSSAGAEGLMQFMPRTFAAYGVDGDGDGRAQIRNDADSIHSAANYLTKSGVTNGQAGVIKALWAYNRSVSYRNDVLFYAHSYATGDRIVVVGEQEDCGDLPGDGDPSLPPLTSDRVAAMFAWGRKQLGEKYVFGANGPNSWDCSSFVRGMYAAAGIKLPRTSESQRQWARKNGFRVKPSQARPGDLVFTNTWRGPNRVGHVMVVYNPAKHTSIEARGKGVGFYKYTDFTGHRVGDSFGLMLDANCGFTVGEAIEFSRRVADLGIVWLEEPIPADDINGSVTVAARSLVPIAGYESQTSLFAFRDLITRGAVDVVQADTIWAGGITNVKRIADLADAWHCTFTPHVYTSAIGLAANLHLLASCTNRGPFEFDGQPNPLRDELTTSPIAPDTQAIIHVSDEPGLGVTLLPDALERYRLID